MYVYYIYIINNQFAYAFFIMALMMYASNDSRSNPREENPLATQVATATMCL